METRYCIEYINPQHPLHDDGSLNVRYDRVLTLEQAEHDLTLILSFGGKILDLYMGNVVDEETGEWSPKPMIIDDDDWFSTKWLNTLEVKKKQEEPVREELEKASKEWLRPQLDKSYVNYGEVKMMELTHFDGHAMLDAIEFGAKWGKNQAMAEIQAQSMALAHGCPEEPVSEDLEEYSASVADELPQGTALTSNGEFDIASVRKLIIDACKFGAKWKEQQMMSKAIVREVKVDAGGYPYIDTTELYDYDKDMPLAKEGDKVKILVIKE